jgi:hypothetical protein
MNYLVVAPDQIPWVRVDTIDMGEGGTRVVGEDAVPLVSGDDPRRGHVLPRVHAGRSAGRAQAPT